MISGLKKSNEMQQYADMYLLLNYSTCFGRPSRPSSGVHKTVVAASGTDHTIWEASFSRLRKLDSPGSNPSGEEIFRPSRPALGPTQPPVK